MAGIEQILARRGRRSSGPPPFTVVNLVGIAAYDLLPRIVRLAPIV